MLAESLSEPRAQSACRVSGLLDHGLTSFAIMSSLPVQPVEVVLCYIGVSGRLHRVFTQPCRLQAWGSRRVIGTESLLVARQQCPYNSGILVGQRHCSNVLMPSIDQLVEPAGCWLIFGKPDHRPRPVNQKRAQIGIAALADSQQD